MRKKWLTRFGTVIMSVSLFSSCMKKETPLPLPPAGNAAFTQVDQGPDYSTQVFFSFDNGVVSSSQCNSWDIAIANNADSPELWLNGGQNVFIHATDATDFSAVTTADGVTGWKYDASSAQPGQSALGNLVSHNELGKVLLIKTGGSTPKYYKIILSVSDGNQLIIKSGHIDAVAPETITTDIDANYNFTYFSFDSGVVKPEPPKADWDIVFTFYRHIYIDYNGPGQDMPYTLSGVLLNPYKTEGAADSTASKDFNDFDLTDAESLNYTNDREIIGFDWKIVDINTASYTVNPNKLYVVQTQDGAWWKLHFTTYYNAQGEKGSPGFEYLRLQ